ELDELVVKVLACLHAILDRPTVCLVGRTRQRVSGREQLSAQRIRSGSVVVLGGDLGVGLDRIETWWCRLSEPVPVGVQQQRAIPPLRHLDRVLGAVELAGALGTAVLEFDVRSGGSNVLGSRA